MSDKLRAPLQTIRGFLDRVTHWSEGKPDRHDALLAMREHACQIDEHARQLHALHEQLRSLEARISIYSFLLAQGSDAIGCLQDAQARMKAALTLAADVNPYGCVKNATARDAARTVLSSLEAQASSTPKGLGSYGLARIAWELERTAKGDGYYGNALRVAKDIPGIDAQARSLLDRYASGSQGHTDHVQLQELALFIDGMARQQALLMGDFTDSEDSPSGTAQPAVFRS
jgi:hypothetical protein